jgi:hypothetical protein
MPKQILQVKDFSGGLNTLKDPADINNNELQVLENLSVKTQGSITPAYLNTDSSNNKISSYNNSTIITIEAGYGLGYFETDHVRDPVTVSQTSSIAGTYTISDGAISGGTARTGFAVYQHNTGNAYKEIEYRISNTQQNLASSFPIGCMLKIEKSGLTSNSLSPSGQGIYFVVQHNGNNIIVDRAISMSIETTTANFWGGTLTGTILGDKVILLANPADHAIDTYSINTAGTNWNNNTITLRSSASGINSKVKFYKIEDEIRCCDTADKNDSKIQWYGWIQRRHFEGTTNTTDSNSYSSYYAKDNTLNKPTSGIVQSKTAGTSGNLATWSNSNSASSTATSVTAGSGFNIALTTETDEDGTISSATYELAQTFIYDDNQESLPAIYSDNHTISSSNDLKSLSLHIATVGPYDPRISGGRIYIREKGTDSEFIMLVDIDLTKGCRIKLSDEYRAWNNDKITFTATTNGNTVLTSVSDVTYIVAGQTVTDSGSAIPNNTTIVTANQSSSQITLSASATTSSGGTSLQLEGSYYTCPDRTVGNNFRVKEFGLITYEILNGFSSSIFSHTIGLQGESWKDVVVANNRAFICNVSIKDENTAASKSSAILKSFPDRIMYSMPNRYDTFPYHNYIEAAKGDADVYTAIDSYGDRLLAFKNRSVDIINIASPDDSSWFLEETKQYMGVYWPEAVKRTQYGLLWLNEQGLFLYNGSKIVNLKENKIKHDTWLSFVGTTSAILYDEKTSLAYLTKSYDGASAGYTVDLKKGTFTQTTNFLLTTNNASNSVDTDDNVLIAYDAGSSIDIYQLYRTEVANTCDFQTKDFDFGNPSVSKKIYAVYVTYKSDGALTGYFTLEEDDGTSHALSGTIGTSSSNYVTVKLTPSSPVTCNKASVKFDSGVNSRKVFINDIGIEYRILKKRAG